MGIDGEIDELDIQILKYLEEDARRSLKKLAELLDKKTSTIYHRLQRMQSNKVIQGYSVIFNPSLFEIQFLAMITISLKPHNIKGLDTRFIESFAQYLKDEFPEIYFISILKERNNIMIISPFKTFNEYESFISNMRVNPYIEDVTSSEIKEIVKGKKLLGFNRDLLASSVVKNKKEAGNAAEELDAENKGAGKKSELIDLNAIEK